MNATSSATLFWSAITNTLWFTGVSDMTVWQDVVISVLLIPIAIFLGNKLINWLHNIKPTQLALKDCLQENKKIFVFHSQMSGADNDWNFNPNQKYITRYPEPLPSNQANLGIQKKFNVDPVMSKAEAECLTDIYNTLGRAGKIKNILNGDLINDWNVWSSPIFSVGFNPKSFKLVEKCDPVYFELIFKNGQGFLKIKDHSISYGSTIPNDAGVVQKTYITGTDIPVFIMAGLGTMGTSAAGYVLSQNIIELGKLYGSKPFCVFLKVKINEGRESVFIDKIYPKPNLDRIALFPLTYVKHNNLKHFKYS